MFNSFFSLQGRVALVTGAAGEIGSTICRLFVDAGAEVIATDVDRARWEGVVPTIPQGPGKIVFQKLDVSEEAEWRELEEYLIKKCRGLDVLVNNAGVILLKRTPESGMPDLEKMVKVNLSAVFLGTRMASRLMPMRVAGTNRLGSIVNMSSVLAMVGAPSAPLYSMVKGAIRSYTKATAVEFCRSKLGIRVNSLHPGLIDGAIATMMLQKGVENGVYKNLEEARRAVLNVYPLGRLGTPEDVARATLFLASDASSFMTGSEVVVDGGFSVA